MIFQAMEVLKKGVVNALMILMTITVVISTGDLAWLLLKDLISPPTLLLDVTELLDLFGLFMLVLIGLELLETIRIYSAEHVVHVESVMMVAIIAVARKAIILDVKELPFQTLVGIAVLLTSLAGGFYLFKRARARYYIAELDDRKCEIPTRK